MSPPLNAPVAADYYVGWLCAVEKEYVIAQQVLDERYPTPSHPADQNSYFCGRIGVHRVVITCLPSGRYGESSAAICATHMARSFPNITVNLMVGIAGGAPNVKNDIRLGDVVVSRPTGRTGGVIHYEYGKTIQNRRFEPTGHLNSPAPALLTAIQTLACIHQNSGHRINETVDSILAQNPRLIEGYSKPELDVLYHSDHTHPQGVSGTCQQLCRGNHVVRRNPRPYTQNQPVVHYGLIASADRVVKDAQIRDRIAEEFDVLCFECEAASLMDFQYLVIRGICDYSDTHKNDMWQGYAAAVAAAYAKELLEIIDPREVPTASELNQTQYQAAPAVSSPYAATSAPIAGGEIKDCKYCRDWSSWALGIGCPKHCSQCRANDGPGITRRALCPRYEYWSKDDMCSLHIRQRDIKEDEDRVRAMQHAVIEAHQQDSSSSPASFDFLLDSQETRQSQNPSPCNIPNGYFGLPTNTVYNYNFTRTVPPDRYNYPASSSRQVNLPRSGPNVSLTGHSSNVPRNGLNLPIPGRSPNVPRNGTNLPISGRSSNVSRNGPNGMIAGRSSNVSRIRPNVSIATRSSGNVRFTGKRS